MRPRSAAAHRTLQPLQLVASPSTGDPPLSQLAVDVCNLADAVAERKAVRSRQREQGGSRSLRHRPKRCAAGRRARSEQAPNIVVQPWCRKRSLAYGGTQSCGRARQHPRHTACFRAGYAALPWSPVVARSRSVRCRSLCDQVCAHVAAIGSMSWSSAVGCAAGCDERTGCNAH